MTMVKIAGNTLHHGFIQAALQQTQGQYKMEKCRNKALQESDPFN